jgi:hypothetical protein
MFIFVQCDGEREQDREPMIACENQSLNLQRCFVTKI